MKKKWKKNSAREITIEEGIKNKIIDYLTIDDEKYIKLKTSHQYYYQVQGQLHVTNRNICYFVVYTPTKEKFNSNLKYCIIKKDDRFWCENIENHLEEFYFGALLPELVDPRHK
jgi:hypothetical protein